MSESPDITKIERIQRLARSSQGQTAQRIAHLFRERDGAKRFKAGWELVESLMIELLDRLNSALVCESSPEASALKLRRATFSFAESERRPAFGERRAALSGFADTFRDRGGLKLGMFPDVQTVLREPLAGDAARMIRWLEGARTGRKKLDIPPGSIDVYATEYEASRANDKRRLSDLLDELVQWRNADSHVDREADTDKRWLQHVTSSGPWWELVGAWIERGLSALLLWEPLSEVLTRTHRHAFKDYSQTSPDAWSARVIEHSPLEFIPRYVVGAGASTVTDRDEWWVEVMPDPARSLRAICPCLDWPAMPPPSPRAELDHQARVATALLEVGYLGDDRRRALAESARNDMVPRSRALALQQEVCDVVSRATGGDVEATRRLTTWVGANEIASRPPAEIGQRRDSAILVLLENEWPIMRDELAEAVGLSPTALDEILRGPSLAPRVHRRMKEGGAESLRPNWEELEEARSTLAAARQHKGASDIESRLAVCVLRLARLLDDGFAVAGSEPEPEPEIRSSAPATLRLDAGPLSADTVPQLLRGLARWVMESGHESALLASLPWRTADGEQLLGTRQSIGPDGTADVPPHMADLLIAERPRRSLALYTIEAECSRLGWMSLSSEREVARDSDPTREHALWLDVRADEDSAWDRVGGGSVREFLSRLFRWIEARGLLDVKCLPVSSGRSRYILNSEPLHSTGKLFLEPLRIAPGLYLETHQSYASALSASQKLCAACGVSLREDGAAALDAGPVRRIADSAGVAEAFRVLFDAALRLGLVPRYYARSVMFAPSANLNRFAFFLRPVPRKHGGVLEVTWSPEAFQTFLGVDPQRAARFLGETRQEITRAEDALRLAERIDGMRSGDRDGSDDVGGAGSGA